MRRLLPLAGALVLAAGCATVGVSPRPIPNQAKARAHFSAGIYRLNQSDYEGAVTELEQAAAYDPESSRIARRLSEAYLRAGDRDRALDAGRRAAELGPDEVENHLYLAALYLQMKRPEDARGQFEEVLRIDPQHLVAQRALAELAASEGDMYTALELLRKMVDDHPERADVRLDLANMYLRLEDLDAARDTLEELERRFPNHAGAKMRLAAIAELQDRPADAIRLYTEVTELRPRNLEAHYRLGVLYAREDKLDEAIDQFEALVAAGPSQPWQYRMALALLYLRADRLDEAAGSLDAVLQRDPNNVAAHYLLGSVFQKQGKTDEAIQEFTKVVTLDERTVQAYMQLGLLYGEENMPEMVIDVLEQALTLDNDVPGLHLLLGAAYRQMKDYDQAIAHFKKATELAPDVALGHFYLGQMYEQTDRLDEAAVALKRTIELEPDNDEALNWLGYMWADADMHLDEAEKLIVRALELDPDNGFYLDSLGWVYYRRGDYPHAVEYLRKALDNLPDDDPIVRDHLGDAYYKLGDVPAAVAEWKRSLAQDPGEDAVRAKILENAPEAADELPPKPAPEDEAAPAMEPAPEPEPAPAPADVPPADTVAL